MVFPTQSSSSHECVSSSRVIWRMEMFLFFATTWYNDGSATSLCRKKGDDHCAATTPSTMVQKKKRDKRSKPFSKKNNDSHSWVDFAWKIHRWALKAVYPSHVKQWLTYPDSVKCQGARVFKKKKKNDTGEAITRRATEGATPTRGTVTKGKACNSKAANLRE